MLKVKSTNCFHNKMYYENKKVCSHFLILWSEGLLKESKISFSKMYKYTI